MPARSCDRSAFLPALRSVVLACLTTSCVTFANVVEKPSRGAIAAVTVAEIGGIIGGAAIDQARCDGGCDALTGDGTRGWGGSLLISFSTFIIADILIAVAWGTLDDK